MKKLSILLITILCLVGPPGVGKTMIATGIGMNACKQGIRVKFWNAKEMMDELYTAVKTGTLMEIMEKLDKKRANYFYANTAKKSLNKIIR